MVLRGLFSRTSNRINNEPFFYKGYDDVSINIFLLQSAWQTFKFKNGQTVEEKITVNDESVDIQVPNKMNTIYDNEQVCLFMFGLDWFGLDDLQLGRLFEI